MEAPMQRFVFFLTLFVTFLAIPASAKQESAEPQPGPKSVEISGTVQSFTSNILDVKLPDSPSVWITIPADLRLDRSALKDGAKVTAKAYWVSTCYVATEVTLQK
jgi:hypothetical protein